MAALEAVAAGKVIPRDVSYQALLPVVPGCNCVATLTVLLFIHCWIFFAVDCPSAGAANLSPICPHRHL